MDLVCGALVRGYRGNLGAGLRHPLDYRRHLNLRSTINRFTAVEKYINLSNKEQAGK